MHMYIYIYIERERENKNSVLVPYSIGRRPVSLDPSSDGK